MAEIKPIVISFTTMAAHPGSARLKKTLEFYGWQYRFVVGAWNGWGGRLKTVLEEGKKFGRLGFTHLIEIDNWDIICTGPPSELGAALESYGNPRLLLAVESACWPGIPGLVDRYPPKTSPWFYPHSQFVLDMTQTIPTGFGELPNDYDDQLHAHDIWLSGQEGVVLDRDCRVIQSIAHSAPWEQFFLIEDGRVRNKITGSRPVFVHGNGQTDTSWVPVKEKV